MRKNTMNRTAWLKYLPVILASTCAPIALTHAAQAQPSHIALLPSNDYNSYMVLGYTATAKKDYTTALLNFRRALRVRPADRYASTAVSNVSSYIAKGGESKLSFVAPNWGAPEPGSRRGGATRGGCSSKNQALTALVPKDNVGWTTAEYPELFFYVPQTSRPLEFALNDQKDKAIYKTNMAHNRTPGLVSVNLSNFKGLPPLKSGQPYHWYMSIICDSQDRSADIVVNGWVKRVEPNPALASSLQQTTPSEHVSLYAVNGFWYDALKALNETRQSSPNNLRVADEWADILKSVGLNEISQ
jgi:hypothetical protein